MARKPKKANIDIRQTARVFDEQAFVDGVFNEDYILVVGSGVILGLQDGYLIRRLIQVDGQKRKEANDYTI